MTLPSPAGRVPSDTPPIGPALALVLVASVLAAASAPATAAPPEAAERARLLEIRREAVGLVERAAHAGTSAPERGQVLAEAARRIEALGSEPSGADLLGAELRSELRRAASLPPEPPALLALLERVRVRLEGEDALGLTFQGSFSQTKKEEPVYGGHASAMGPAPAPLPPGPAPPGGEGSPVSFEEGPRLPTRTWCGGPTKDHILESGGNGVALLDYDDDGLLDVYLVSADELTPARQRVEHRNALYRNLGEWRFEDVSKAAGVDAPGWSNGVCAGDADGDGRLDLYVTRWGPNLLYLNQGDGSFTEAAQEAGVQAGGWSTGCSFFDADADGDLDLYVARYVETTWDEVVRARRTLVWRSGPPIMVGPAGLPGESDLFFENLGQGQFREATAAHGLDDPAGAYGFGVVATDYDDDSFVDLFVANDSRPNFLYRNRGDGRFESVGLLSGVAVNRDGRAQAGMGADSGDFDGDGRLDLVLTAFAHDNNSLYRNLDGRHFEDASVEAGLAAPTFERMGWGVAFLDADLDGALDLFVANGHIFADVEDYPQLGEAYGQKNQLLLNRQGTFKDVSAGAGGGLQVARVGRGLAVGDLDGDGDLDLVVSHVDDRPTLLENRQRTGHHWVSFRLRAPSGNRLAIGAKVTVEGGGRRQVREVRSGGSYLSQSDLRPHFGLGAHGGPVDVEVRLPGGRRWRFESLPVDRLHVLELPDSTALPPATR